MIAITTSSSMSVNARVLCGIGVLLKYAKKRRRTAEVERDAAHLA
jgi:hypothetical protein